MRSRGREACVEWNELYGGVSGPQISHEAGIQRRVVSSRTDSAAVGGFAEQYFVKGGEWCGRQASMRLIRNQSAVTDYEAV